MAKIKDLLEGLLEEFLDLPAAWARTHVLLLKRGVLGAIEVERRSRAKDGLYLGLRTLAFFDVILAVAIWRAALFGKGETISDWLLNVAVAVPTSAEGIGKQSVLLTFVSLLIVSYYTAYVVMLAAPVTRVKRKMALGLAIFTAAASYSLLLFAHLVFAARWVLLTPEVTKVVAALVVYGTAFLGYLASGRVIVAFADGRQTHPKLKMLGWAVALFLAQVAAMLIFFPADTLWPNYPS